MRRATRERARRCPNLARRSEMIERTCSVEGCERTARARGWCKTHWRRWRKYGDPTFNQRTDNGEAFRWLAAAVLTRDRSECWVWPFGQAHGYGEVRFEGRYRYAPGVALEMDGQPRPDGLECCHSCVLPDGRSHRLCVNPDHLRWDTRAANIEDMVRAGVRKGRTTVWGSSHGNAKLTEADVIEIRQTGRSVPTAELASRFGVRRATINDVLAGRSWRLLLCDNASATFRAKTVEKLGLRPGDYVSYETGDAKVQWIG